MQSSDRTEGNYRLFAPQTVQRLAFIKRLQAMGLSLQAVKECLAIHNCGNLPCAVIQQQLQERVRGIEQEMMAVFGTAGLVTLATASGFMGMMGFSLAMLASLKLMDIESFAESYANYDLVTQRYKPYGKIYPFAELAIALGFLSGVASGVVGIASMLIGIVGGISVFKAVYIDKKSLNCACIGGNSQAPLQIVSFSENLIMAVMGAYLSATTVTGAVPTKPVGEILQPQVQISQVKSHTVP